ncbi:16080_t:CDS:2 [Entrophospora sp. SA101]|nr:8473_t:CDS:2 [Entrophospora sp. SA101]CAJ0760605.1 3217_t:CDS:2 [Entrophospora sp. SA101]CAJ0765015.1 16080_t:CDS:2 [Entrophospora sp. SA101]CAJ0906126.1 6649_t:CDS:2 [Entrophospora sp. SA101]CAJ0906138.1 6652_t:CDS:2 [Entrophospora sp. SA101]
MDNNRKTSNNWDNDKKVVLVSHLDEVPITVERKVPHNLEETLGNPGLPRANVAASREKPNGTIGNVKRRTVDFWDTDHDGVIRPFDTYQGFRRLGFNIFYCIFSAVSLHLSIAYMTQKSWIPFLGNPFFKIYTDRIYKCKHGSDSESYDTEGRFVPQKFEELFSKYDKNNKGGLNSRDILNLIYGNGNVWDPVGWAFAAFEWGTLYMLCADEHVANEYEKRKNHHSLFPIEKLDKHNFFQKED